MSFRRDDIANALAASPIVARVVVAETRGSAPREVGAAMIVWQGGQSGTIGGGRLEFEAAARARAAVTEQRDRVDRIALGPDMGQCCGGAVTLVTQIWTAERLEALNGPVVASGQGARPAALDRLPRDLGAPLFKQGWLVEPVLRANRALWIWGAGHVGRAIVTVMAPLPQFDIHWADTSAERFPEHGLTRCHVSDPLPDLVDQCSDRAEHLVLTYSHDIDLEICHRLLQRGFGWAGLIGSGTKWARFRRRLRALGHDEADVARIACPIGAPELGKHPQAIALGVAHQLLGGSAGK